jgi:hypothetical protein
MPSFSPQSKIPLAICYGTRPQVIKASLLIEALSRHWRVVTVDTLLVSVPFSAVHAAGTLSDR